MQPEHDALTDERVPYTLCWFGAVSEIPLETVPDINEPGQAAAMLEAYFAMNPDDEPQPLCTYCQMELISPSYTWQCAVCGRKERMETCHKCGSLDIGCYDESYVTFEDKAGQLFDLPVGFFKCRECKSCWQSYDWTDDDGTPLQQVG